MLEITHQLHSSNDQEYVNLTKEHDGSSPEMTIRRVAECQRTGNYVNIVLVACVMQTEGKWEHVKAIDIVSTRAVATCKAL